jgi:uncharacterized membrane protein YccC
MKQYKLTAWPDLPPRLQKTTCRRVVSELSQRFVSVRDLARSSGGASRDVEELVDWLQAQGLLMMRDAPQAVKAGGGWRDWGLVAAFRGLVRAWR